MIAISVVVRGRAIIYTSYLASVAADGRDPAGPRDTMNIRSTEPIVMGTTGSKPKTVVPAAIREMTLTPPTPHTVSADPGAGAATTACSTATTSTHPALPTRPARPARV